MNKTCEIVQDLLPLYVDGACSPASMEMVEEHLASCPQCASLYRAMISHDEEEVLRHETDGVLTRHAQRENRRLVWYLFLAACVLYFPCILLLSLVSEPSGMIATPYYFRLAAAYLTTFPLYLAFIVIGTMLFKVFDKRVRGRTERIFDTIAVVLSCLILLMALYYSLFLLPALGLTVILLINQTVAAIVCHRKPRILGILRKKTFWCCLLILTLVIILVIAVSVIFGTTRNVKEDYVETTVSMGVRELGSEYDGVFFELDAVEKQMWYLLGDSPKVTVRIVNETDTELVTDPTYELYRKTGDEWQHCLSYNTVPRRILARDQTRESYTLAPYDFGEGGVYRLVVYVEGKPIRMDFEVTMERGQ
ncbi:MAG: zf-HC2 domain-containing protein [Clostridia bacterium]|nr:zf-HC2 domain-containing protein [Clostridia bacterium]